MNRYRILVMANGGVVTYIVDAHDMSSAIQAAGYPTTTIRAELVDSTNEVDLT